MRWRRVATAVGSILAGEDALYFAGLLVLAVGVWQGYGLSSALIIAGGALILAALIRVLAS